MNTSLYFKNLTDEELLQILNVISVPCLMEPLKKQARRYFGKGHKGQSLSREAVNHIYLKFLKAGDLVLSLYLSDLVVDIIHFFKLSDDFKRLLTTDDADYPQKLVKKIKKRHCPITVDMFMRLLDAHYAEKKAKAAYDIEIEETAEAEPENNVIDETVLDETIGAPMHNSEMPAVEEFRNSDFFDVLPEVCVDEDQKDSLEATLVVSNEEDEIEIPSLDLFSESECDITQAQTKIEDSLEIPEIVDANDKQEAQQPPVSEAHNQTEVSVEISEIVDADDKQEAQQPPVTEAQDQTEASVEIPEIVDADDMQAAETQPNVEDRMETEQFVKEAEAAEINSDADSIDSSAEPAADLDDAEEASNDSEKNVEQEAAPVVFEEKNEDAIIVDDQKIAQLEKEISNLQYQIMTLQMENESLKDENRDLLFQGEDESERDSLKQDIDLLEADNAHLKEDMANLTSRNQQLEKELADFQTAKEHENQMRLELRDYKIKYISLQSEYDQLQYKQKNDNKRLKELENKQRTVHESKDDLMMALHDLNWYKKQWHLPGDAPIHQIWLHLNNVESKKLKELMKKYDRMVKSEKQEQVEELKEILLVKEAILILLKANRQVKNKSEDTKAAF